MAESTEYLELHRSKYRVRVRVPDAVRHLFGGKVYLRQSLGTGNLKTASALKGEHVSRFKLQIAEALASVHPGATMWEEAKVLRTRHRAPALESTTDTAFEIVHRAEELARSEGFETAKAFADTAFGRTTPLTDHLEDFIGDKAYRPKSVLDLRRVMKWLATWLGQKHVPLTLETITQPVAGDFMRHLVVARQLDRKNAGKYISFLRTYWGWMEEQGHRPRNSSPWLGRLPEAKAPARGIILEPDGGKRAFTNDEMKRLLMGDPKQHIADLIRIAALSGMRLEECYLLRVRDAADGCFSVLTGKTANSTRKIPIHPDLKPIVERLSKDKKATDFLLDPEAEIVEHTQIRSQAASKAFGYYRRGLGIDERPNNKAKSNVEFHSFRRWFIQQARNALLAGAEGFNEWTIADVVGHSKDDLPLALTMSHYPGPSPETAKLACVKAVRLPQPEKALEQ
jgi:integrase